MSKTRGEVLASALETLGVEYARDCQVMMASCLGCSQAGLRLSLDELISTDEAERFSAMVAERARNRPVAQIVGKRDFWKHEFIVSDVVLDPRPDTETLVEAALELPTFSRVLDLGTGSGCILLSLLAEKPNSSGLGVDISASALKVAQQNAHNLNLSDRADFREGNWLEGLTEQFDLIVSNPPYISASEMLTLDPDVAQFEPRLALTPEGDGLDAYRQIAQGVAPNMTPYGTLILEIGADQKKTVSEIFKTNGFVLDRALQDINAKDRVLQFKFGK